MILVILLHKNGKWDYDLYRKNDIHAIKGAERAHKLLIRLGENPLKAKEIALAILLYGLLPTGGRDYSEHRFKRL